MTTRKASAQARLSAIAFFIAACLFGIITFLALSSNSTLAKVAFSFGSGIFFLLSILYFVHYRNLVKREQNKPLLKDEEGNISQ